MIYQARYYDGLKAEPRDVQVSEGSASLRIENPAESFLFEWKYTDVRIIEKPEHERPLLISHAIKKESRIVVNDTSLYDVLIKRIPKGNAPRIVISTASGSLILWAIPAMLIMVAIYGAMPSLTVFVAENFPRTWEKSLGEYAIEALTGNTKACENAQGVAALNKLVSVLAASAENRPQVTARVIAMKQVNAFAAPGGQIVIFSKLIDMTENPDELSGVIAHEIGHIVKHHPTQMLIRSLGFEMLIKILFGGAGDTATAASLANGVYQLHYGQNFEREADQIATQILYDSGVDNHGFINFFIRLEAGEKGINNDLLSYLSTHPPTAERIDAIEKARNVAATRPILTDMEWKSLKNICKENK